MAWRGGRIAWREEGWHGGGEGFYFGEGGRKHEMNIFPKSQSQCHILPLVSGRDIDKVYIDGSCELID